MAFDVGQKRLVRALYSFKGTNNDELCFDKDDIVTITQAIDGGWWEGTLADKTGWFPSNYVQDLSQDTRTEATSPVQKIEQPMNKRESMLFYRNIVLQSLLESEQAFVAQLTALINSYLRPLQASKLLASLEYSHLVGNLEDVAAFHRRFLASVDAISKFPLSQQLIGGAFLKCASQAKSIYTSYCSNHPYAVSLLQCRSEELTQFMETQGATPPGMMSLTTSLSSPFTRLDKYPAVLKEFERHTDEGHADRGDTQRAISVYKEIIASCKDARKHKEMELDILCSSIRSWEGESISRLGEVLLMTHVKLRVESGESTDHIMLLFHTTLVLLTVNTQLSGYLLQSKDLLHGLVVNQLEEADTYCFEITGSVSERLVICCHSSSERQEWVDSMRQHITIQHNSTSHKLQNIQISTSQPSISALTKAKMALAAQQPPVRSHNIWTMSCLRPSPPIRPSTFLKDDANRGRFNTIGRRKPDRVHSDDDVLGYYNKIDDSKTLEDDALILRVVEAYCTSAKTRHTVNSSILSSPQLLIAEDEKIIVEELKGDQIVVEEKSLVDTIYLLRDEVNVIASEQKRLRKDFAEEKKARHQLETYIYKSICKATTDVPLQAAAIKANCKDDSLIDNNNL